MSINDYHGTAADWREQLRQNERRTRWVVISFIALFVASA